MGADPGETTIFVYDAAGKLVAEYSTIVASTQDAEVAYLTSDHLGSPRINSDRDGGITARHDYYPFGEEVVTSQRTANLGYADDAVRKQFTGYERDDETGLDFAQARYYAKNHGRFTSVDPLLASAKPPDPQTWNRFVYVLNNPLRYTDTTGLCPEPTLRPGEVGICVEAFIAAKKIDGIGDGDNRTHSSNSNDSARMRAVSVFTATETSIAQDDRENLVSGSSVSATVVDPHTGTAADVGPPALPAGGTARVDFSTTAERGTAGFGNGLTTSTTVSVELRNGANGFQVAGDQLQAAGAVQITAGNKVEGVITNVVGRVVSAAAPDGTIDVSARIRISGSGDNIRVSATASSRPYPSVTGWAYIGMSDGSTKTIQLFKQNEARPRDLTKPMRPIR